MLVYCCVDRHVTGPALKERRPAIRKPCTGRYHLLEGAEVQDGIETGRAQEGKRTRRDCA